MLRRNTVVSFALLSGAGLLVGLALLGAAHQRAIGQPPEATPSMQLLIGDADLIEGHLVVTWARVLKGEQVKEVGVTIPVGLFDAMPEHGSGPAGAIASLTFPAIAQDTTYFNHFQLHSNPHGHIAPPGSVNPDRNLVPHFDFHFYAIAEELVSLIPATTAPPRPIAVPDALLPVGYMQPGTSIAEMGRHSSPLSAFLDPNPLSTVMLAGFTVPGDQMHFVEPMISREFLLERNDFELAMPMPAAFGRSMLYPTRFAGEYDTDSDAYHFVFSEFVAVE